MANETNGQLNFVSLFFFSFVFHFTQSCPPNLNVVSGSLILFEIKEQEGLYLNIWSQKTQKQQKKLLVQNNSGEAKRGSIVDVELFVDAQQRILKNKQTLLLESKKQKLFYFSLHFSLISQP